VQLRDTDYEDYTETTNNITTFTACISAIMTTSINSLFYKSPFDELQDMLGVDACARPGVQEVLMWACAFSPTSTKEHTATKIATMVAEIVNKEGTEKTRLREFIEQCPLKTTAVSEAIALFA